MPTNATPRSAASLRSGESKNSDHDQHAAELSVEILDHAVGGITYR